MQGWGSFTPEDGCFHRVRYTGDRVQIPVACRAHENGIVVRFAEPLDPELATRVENHFVQAWNYRYSESYGSPEFSPQHDGVRGHDVWWIRSAHVLDDGQALFLELPELQPVNQVHLYLQVDGGPPQELFVTVHRLAEPFTEFPGYRPYGKTIAPHPLLVDLQRRIPRAPNPHATPLPQARTLALQAATNLSFSERTLRARSGEPLALTFSNPDVVPHNWALVRPGALQRFGELADRYVADPQAIATHYVPPSDDVLAYTDMVQPGQSFTIYFHAPQEPGRYPFLCTFPGHWKLMQGELIVE
jgi:azurin